MYIAYNNYVALQQQNEASTTIYPNYVASNLGRRSTVNKFDTPCKIIATASSTDGSKEQRRGNERQINAKMLEQGTLHRCAMLRYKMTRSSSAKLEQVTASL